jgi:cobalt-zinc-cadmium efflux system outer membrane protein
MMLLESIPKVSTEFDIERNPNYRALVAERNAYKFQIESARIEARPNASAYIGARNFNGDNSTAFVGGISVSVPIFNNNSGNISASSAEFQASEARLTNFALRTEGQRRVLINRINSISQRLSSIESAILSAEETYRMSKIGFQAGRINLIEVQTARTTLFELKQLTISNLLERVRAESDLAMIEGRIPYGASQ